MLLISYGALHLLLRWSLSDTIGVDDAIEGVFTQSLAPGYDTRQPPLYTWLLWLVQQVTGPALLSFLLLKYVLLTLTLLCYYRIAGRLQGDARYAALTMWSLLLLYQIGWNAHEGVTQTQVLMLACAGSLLAFLRAAEHGRWQDYLLFGLAVGAGLLAKWSFGAFLFCLAAGALAVPTFRHAVLSSKTAAALVLSAAMTTPYMLWLVGDGTDMAAVFRSAVGHTGDAGSNVDPAQIGKGLWSAVKTALGFLSPLLPILILIFPRALRPRPNPDPAPNRDLERLAGVMVLAGLGLMVLGAVFAGIDNYKERWLHPLLIAAPLYFFARIRRAAPSDLRLRIFVGTVIAISAIVVGIRASHLVVGPPLCNKCRPLVPYAGLAEKLAQAGFRGGTIVVRNGNTAGNLRAAFPDVRIYVLNNPTFHPPAAPDQAGRQCLVVWPVHNLSNGFPEDAVQYLDLPRSAAPSFEIREARISWNLIGRPPDARVSRWDYVLFDGPRGRCR